LFSRKRGQLISILLILTILIITITYALQSSTLIPSSGTIYYQPEAQLLFNDGYETGNFDAWTGTQITTNDQATVIATNAYEGNYHAQLQTNAITSGTKYAYSYITLPTPISEVYTRAYFYIVDGLPLDDNDDRFGLIAYEVNGQLQCTFRIHRSGGIDKFNVIGLNGTGTVQKSTDTIYPVKGEWYCLEFYIKVHSLKGEYRAWINGIEQITITNVDTTRYGNGVNRIRVGLTSTINVQHSVMVYCDAVAISTRYIGPIEPKILFKDGFESGDFKVWSGTKTSSSDKAMISTTNPYFRKFHAEYQTSAISSGTKYAYSYITLPTPISEVYTRAYFYIVDGLPLDDNDDRFGLIAFEANNQLLCTFRVHRSGGIDKFNIIGYNGDSTVQRSTDIIYPAKGEWYCLEFYIKVHSIKGEYRAWINGIEQIAITDVNNTRYGWGVNRIRVGLTSTINVQHSVTVHCDVVAVSNKYIGPFYEFAVIGSPTQNPAIRNFYWLFGNQSIRYKTLLPSNVKCSADIDLFEGLVVWTKQGGYNAEAIKNFAKTRVVIADMRDFCNTLYPSLNSSIQIVTTNTVTYTVNWGNFRCGDLVEMRNETGNTNKLTMISTSALARFGNTSTIAQYDSNHVAFFHMNGTKTNSGFYVMDLDATTPETEWTGIWHIFPAVKMVRDFPTGMYARWMANGQQWRDLNWIYNYIDTIVNENTDIATKRVIGYSVENREIPAIFIGKGAKYAIIDGAIHGNEKTGPFACLRVAELLIQYYRTDPYWKSRLSEYTVIIIPVLNPDGFVKNTRENANGKDLNSQFPPDATPTEPEALALINLMSNYKPTVYVNIHEGWYWYPLDMLCGNYESGANKTLTINAMKAANNTFTELRHWGWFTENNASIWIGKVRAIYTGGKKGMAIAYASYYYKASCMLLETFVWSPTWGARKSLWALDYYPSVILSFIKNIQR